MTEYLSRLHLTDCYATSENGRVYLRADIDSRYHVCGPEDWQREEQTGIPAYVGWQAEIYPCATVDDLYQQLKQVTFHWVIPDKAVQALIRLLGIRLESAA